MAKDKFDMDFDFEKEYGFDPNEFLDGDQDADIDISDFSEDAAVPAASEAEGDLSDLDLDLSDLDLDGLDLSDLDLGDIDLNGFDLEDTPAEVPAQDAFSFDAPASESYLQDAYRPEPVQEAFFEPQVPQEPEMFSGPDVLIDRRREPDFFDDIEDFDATDLDDDDFEKSVFGQDAERPVYQEPVYADQAPIYPDPQEMPAGFGEQPQYAPEGHAGFEPQPLQEQPVPERRPGRQPKPPKEKPAGPNFIEKLIAYYMAPLREEEQPVDPNNPRRRRRKRTKAQIFKEVYLPPLLAGVTLIIILAFLFGSITNAIQQKKIDNDIAIRESQQAAEEAERLEEEAQMVIEEAERLAQGYDYAGAVDLLNAYSGEKTQEMNMKIAEYTNTQAKLVEYKDYSSIPNLSFHVLIADPARAFADKGLGGQYNRNFVTVDEFEKILEQLYKAGYVLVDFDSFTETNTGLDGNANFFTTPIALPEGKKPVMITETMVNYFSYMVDSNEDGEPDAGGAGFAYRMVVDENGDIKAQMVDANGQTQTGNYDLVPILEDFIKAHPDFSYKGARATLAVCGYEGVFGYRTNTSYISSVSQAYYDEQVAGAKTLVEALRNKGYTIACYTYGNIAYGDRSATQIQADLQEWTNQITPVVGNVDVLVYARTSDIGDYGGAKFQVLNGVGFRFFVRHGSQPYAEINNTYVKQSRLMVTGENMAWNSNQFSGMFDCAAILNNLRGNVPKG